MNLELEGRVAWVLGASSGIGRATAESLAREGCAVAVSARRAEVLDEVATNITSTGGRCLAVPVDVTDAASIDAGAEQVRARLGPVDILIANGGGPPAGAFVDLSESELNDAFSLTVASAWRLTKAVVPAMRAKRAGFIAFITSSSTQEVITGLLLSNSLRAAVVGLAKTLSKELGPDGIRVVCVAPGRIRTPRSDRLDGLRARRRGISIEELRDEAQANIPLRRYGKPDEIGDVIAFLASERAAYVTGISVLVDGGMLDSL